MSYMPCMAFKFKDDSSPDFLFTRCSIFLLLFIFCFFIWTFSFPIPACFSIPNPTPYSIYSSASSPNFIRFCCFRTSVISYNYFVLLCLLPPLFFLGCISGIYIGFYCLISPPSSCTFSNLKYISSLSLAPKFYEVPK